MFESHRARADSCCVCGKSSWKYVCPKCEQPTCSLPCHRGHSSACNERFFQESVESELAFSRVSNADATAFAKRLAKLNQEFAEEDDACREREEELRRRALAGDLDLADLTDEERDRFFEALAVGDVSLEEFEPLWFESVLPDISDSVALAPHVCCSASRTVHSSSLSLVVEACYAVAFMLRWTHGEFETSDDPRLTGALLHLLPHFTCIVQDLPDIDELLPELRRRACEPAVGCTDSHLTRLVLADCIAILETRDFVLKLFEIALTKLSVEPHADRASRSAVRKLWFAASLVLYHYDVVAEKSEIRPAKDIDIDAPPFVDVEAVVDTLRLAFERAEN